VVIYLIGGTIVFVPIIAMILILLFSWYAQASMKYTVEQTYRASGEKSGLLLETLTSNEAVKA